MNPYAVRVNLYFEPLDGQEHAPDGPGWYLLATRSGAREDESGLKTLVVTEIIPRVRLTNAEAPKLAKVLDKFAEGKPLNWSNLPHEDISLEQAFLEAIEAGGEVVRQQLAEAENAVERLENLRRRAAEFAPPAES